MAGITRQPATTIVDAALWKARETGCAPLAVAALDPGGHRKAFAREDGGASSARRSHGKGLGRARDGHRLPRAGPPGGPPASVPSTTAASPPRADGERLSVQGLVSQECQGIGRPAQP